MKKLLSLFLVVCFGLILTACSNNDSSQEQQPAETKQEETAEPSATSDEALIVYFSWSGNTEALANEIQEQTSADIFKITPQEPYTDDYDTLLDIAQEEQTNDERPAIAETIENFDEYDTVFVGYPNWWGDMPMILYSFFDSYDLSGKTIIPFVTSGGSGFSSTIESIESLEPDATVLEGLSIRDDDAENAAEEVEEWLNSLNFNGE